jgi:hypothetical protein
MAAEEHHQAADEVLLRNLPGKLAILVFAAATVALLWEVSGILFQFSWPFIRPLSTLDAGHIIGVAMFTTGWLGLLIGLLVLRHRGRLRAD